MLHICKFIFSITIGTIYLSKGERFIMKTGERIKTIRKSQGITQAKLAETLHISSSFMSRIENGSSSLTLDFVCEIADALQVTRQEVLRDVFTYTKDDSILISKKIEINIQKFSPEKQAEILDVLEFLDTIVESLKKSCNQLYVYDNPKEFMDNIAIHKNDIVFSAIWTS